MYGYIRPDGGTLRPEDCAVYRAVTCGVCRAQRRACGLFSALRLRHETVFLALCRAVCEGEPLTFSPHTCPLHPFRRRPMAGENRAIGYAAGAAALLAWIRQLDELSDRRGLGRFFTAVRTRTVFRRLRRSGMKAAASGLLDLLSELSDIERQATPSVDLPAMLTGRITAEIFAADSPPQNRDLLYTIGDRIGRFVYLADALDDFRADIRSGNYNPYSILYKNEEDLAEDAENDLAIELEALEAAVSRLPFDELPEARPIVMNIVREGLPCRAREILERYRKTGMASAPEGERPLKKNRGNEP